MPPCEPCPETWPAVALSVIMTCWALWEVSRRLLLEGKKGE